MTITKAIALAALTGTLALAPGAAFAKSDNNHQSTEHGNSATAHQNNTDRATERATAKSERDAARADRTNQQDVDDEDDNDNEDEDAGGNSAEARSKLTVGRIVASIRGGGAPDLSTFSGTGDNVTIYSEAQLQDVAQGKSYVAIEKALNSVNPPDLQTSLSENTAIDAALTVRKTNPSTVQYAYVDASGNLVVITQ